MGIKNINARFILWVCSEIPSLQVCNGNHGVWRCDKFKDLGIQERWDTAKRLNLCFRSLGADHRGLTCVRSRICGINSCRETRNRLLHVYKDRNKTLVLSTRLIKPKFCFDLSHRRSTTVSLETRNLFTRIEDSKFPQNQHQTGTKQLSVHLTQKTSRSLKTRKFLWFFFLLGRLVTNKPRDHTQLPHQMIHKQDLLLCEQFL